MVFIMDGPWLKVCGAYTHAGTLLLTRRRQCNRPDSGNFTDYVYFGPEIKWSRM